MRKENLYGMPRAEAIAMLARSRVVRMATTDAEGAPIFRTVDAVIVDDAICFHGAPVGEKIEAVGRAAVLQVEETIAAVPSWFVDAERACPATTYYRSAQVHGTIERVDDRPTKARVLQALMEKLQPEGKHVPIAPDHPLYARALDGVLVLRVPLERVDGKAKLGQNRSPAERAKILELLWRRGDARDLRAIDLVRSAAPTLEPPFLAAPPGVCLAVTPGGNDDERAVVELLDGTYWNAGSFTRDEIAAAHRDATAWVGARDDAGRLIASARAISDGAKYAWVYDVIVAERFRGRGVGASVVRLLLDHPRVRGARKVLLHTRDAQRLYGSHGFVDASTLPRPAYPRTEMVLVRRPTIEVSPPCPSSSTARNSGTLPTSIPASSR